MARSDPSPKRNKAILTDRHAATKALYSLTSRLGRTHKIAHFWNPIIVVVSKRSKRCSGTFFPK